MIGYGSLADLYTKFIVYEVRNLILTGRNFSGITLKNELGTIEPNLSRFALILLICDVEHPKSWPIDPALAVEVVSAISA